MAGHSSAADLAVEGIGKVFGAYHALKNLALTIQHGEFLTLLGPSGSGKTTFLMILAGFERPSSGRLYRNGRDMTDLPPEARAFGMVFQGYALFPHLTVEQNIAFPLKVRRHSPAAIRRRVGEMIERVGLIGHEKKRPAGLSGGQQQRVALARALAFEPALLLLDEPFSALDKHLRGLMQEEMRRLHQELGTTFVMVTHDQEEALALSSRVAIFNHGELLQIGAPETVYNQPANRFVAEFLGEINLVPLAELGQPGGGFLAIRPEHLRLTARPDPGVPALQARVVTDTYLGAATRFALATPAGTRLTLTLDADQGAALRRAGAELWLSWAPDKSFVLPA